VSNKKQIITISLISLLFTLIFPPLGIAPIVFLFSVKIKGWDWVIFFSIFFGLLFLLNFATWFNSSLNLHEMLISFLIISLQYLIIPIIFAFLFNLLFKLSNRYKTPILITILLGSIPFFIYIGGIVLFIKQSGYSIMQLLPFAESTTFQDPEVAEEIKNLISRAYYDILPKGITAFSILISFLVEQHFVYYIKKGGSIMNGYIKPIETSFLPKLFSFITMIGMYTLLILNFILKIKNQALEIFLYNIFFLCTTVHFINGIGVIVALVKRGLSKYMIQLNDTFTQKPALKLLINISLIMLIILVLPYIIYLYIAIAFLSTIDSVYNFRKLPDKAS